MKKKIQILFSMAMRKLRMLSSFGFRYRCPLCGWTAHTFYTDGLTHPVLKEMQVIGAGKRPNAKCPRCGSKERDRFIYLHLEKSGLLNDTSKKILHVAPEKKLGPLLRARFKKNYISTDLYTPTVDVNADVQQLPFPDHSFDVIICNHVLEHVDDDKKALREFYRVLRPGGILIAQIPFSPLLKATRENPQIKDPREREREFGQDDHVRLYGTDYIIRMSDAGFETTHLSLNQFLTAGEISKYALNEHEPLMLNKKQ